MQIERAPRRNHFTILNNSLLQDGSLSFGARGLAGYLLSLPDGKQIDIKSLAAGAPDGRQAIASLLRELETARYLVRTRERAERGRIRTICRMHDEPQNAVPAGLPAPWSKARTSTEPTPDIIDDVASSQFGPKPGLPDFGQPDFGQPDSGQPDSGSPDFKKTKNQGKKPPSSLPSGEPAGDGRTEEAEEEMPSANENQKRGTSEVPREGVASSHGATADVSAVQNQSMAGHGEAAAVVDALPAVHGHRVSRAQRPQLMEAVTARLAQGWTAEDLRAELTRDLGTAQGTGVFFHRLTSLPDVPPAVISKPVPSVPAPRPAEVAPHAWVDGGPNGACLDCGASQLAAQHQEHQEQARRSVRRCEHGRVIHVCPTCREGAEKAPETAEEPQTARTEASAMDPRLSKLLSAVAATSARR